MAFNQSGEYLVVGSDTETVHLFRCSTSPKTESHNPITRTWSGGWSGGSGTMSLTMESPVDEDADRVNMDRVIEQKRRNGSMG